MWKFYDRIINQIPDDLDACIDYIHVGPMWTIVTAGKYAGIAVTVNEQNKQIPDMNHLLHMPLKEAAAFCKSQMCIRDRDKDKDYLADQTD